MTERNEPLGIVLGILLTLGFACADGRDYLVASRWVDASKGGYAGLGVW